MFLPVEGGPQLGGGRGTTPPSGAQLGCPEGSSASLSVNARTGEWQMWCTRRVIQEIALPAPPAEMGEKDPLPDLEPGATVPGTRIVGQGAQRPTMNCPAGSAPSVVGNDSFRGTLVWECVKTWTQAAPASDDSDEEAPDSAPALVLSEVAAVTEGSRISVGITSRASVQLSAEHQSNRVAALTGAVEGVLDANPAQAGAAAALLSETYADAALGTLTGSERRTVARQLATLKIDSPAEGLLVKKVATQATSDLGEVLSALNVERPNETAKALADVRVQSLLKAEPPEDIAVQAEMAITAGNFASAAGILRTVSPVPAVEYRIAEALSKGDLARARSLASGVWSFKSSIVTMALEELLQAQGQTSTAARISASKALADGKLKAGAWYAFSGTAPQKCATTGCAWLG